ncbi:MAG: NmrA family NAD(P)-binding protein [Pseudomonadota bacterium]
MLAQSKVLIVGGTGSLGGEITRLLSEAGHEVRVLVRQTTEPGKRESLERLHGVQLVPGDLKDPRSLDAACTGIDVVVSTASAIPPHQPDDSIEAVDERGQLALVAAAERARLRRFVFVSFAPQPATFALQSAKRKVEAALASSSLDFTVLQPTFFIEFWLSAHAKFDPMNGEVQILGDGNQRTSWVSVHDVARFALAACDDPAFSRITLPLGGPDALSPFEVVKIFEELGAPTRKDEPPVPAEALLANVLAAPNPVAEAFAALMHGAAVGQPIDAGPQLRLLSGRLTTVRDYARAIQQRNKEER